MRLDRVFGVVSAAVLFFGCNDRSVDLCEPGATQACICSDGRAGAQICHVAGSAWGDCDCGLIPDSESQPGDARPPDAGVDAPSADSVLSDSVVADGPAVCDGTGACHPSGNGQACIGGKWTMPPCNDPGYGCGATLDASTGFCDPRWSECVGPTASYTSCATYCAWIGKTCKENCITSRNYPNWGAEAWLSAPDCQKPLSPGKGQKPCSFLWDGTGPRWRCCCN